MSEENYYRDIWLNGKECEDMILLDVSQSWQIALEEVRRGGGGGYSYLKNKGNLLTVDTVTRRIKVIYLL